MPECYRNPYQWPLGAIHLHAQALSKVALGFCEAERSSELFASDGFDSLNIWFRRLHRVPFDRETASCGRRMALRRTFREIVA